MNGKTLSQAFMNFIDTREISEDYASQHKIYKCLDMAAAIFIRDIRLLHNTCIIPTVAGVSSYPLPPDFLDLYITDRRGRSLIKYHNGVHNSFPCLIDESEIFLAANTTPVSIPPAIAISDVTPDSLPALITGTATATGAAANGRCILADTAKNFTTLNVFPRDIVHNGADGSMGCVLDVIDDTHLGVALFGGANNDWTTADAYAIQSAAKKSLILCAPPELSGHVMTIPYICMPAPVFSDYGNWPLPDYTCNAIAAGAAALFKLPKMEYVESQAMGGLFNEELKRYKVERGIAKLKQGPSHRRERIL